MRLPEKKLTKISSKPQVAEIGIWLMNFSKSKIGKQMIAKIDIEIWRADEPLTQDNYRPIHDGGLLIHGKNTIYDSTLFKYNSDVFAAKLFGKVRCDYLDTLLKNDDMIIEGSRYGLDGRHSFNKKLSEVICKELEVIVKEERKLAESQKERDLNEKTKQRFRKAVDFLNKIAQAELKGAEGDVKQEDDVGEPDPKIPDEGFGFVPDYYHIQTGKKSVIILRVLVPKIIENGAVIKLSSTSSEVIIDEAYIELNVNQELSENGVQQFNIPILGKQVGSIANIMAKAQDHVAVAQIKVVSQPEETKKEHTPKIKKKKHGIFNEIKYDPTLDPSQRAYFDEASGDIKIATKAASVDLYLEPHTESPETLHCQVLVAEIVLDTVVKVLIKQKRDRSLLVALTDKGIVDMIENEKNKLISKYSADVHRALVDNKAFRKKYE